MTYANSASMSYGYTTAGDLTSLAIQMAGTGNDVTYTLGYTAAHELDSEAASIAKFVWYPGTTGGTDAYGSANNLNQYPNVTFAGQSKQRLSYDGNGSLTSDGNFAYTYDPENRLLSATGSSTTTYANDPRGRRATKVSGGTTTNFLDDGDDEDQPDHDGTGALLRFRFVPGPAIDEPITAEVLPPPGTYEYFHTDHHGSVVAMSASSGGLTEGPFLYDSYGNSTCSGAGGVPFRYTGQYLDPETCLYYYRARYYSPAMGRFLQVDPVGYTADMDLYTYVGNDPTNMTDAYGEAADQCTTDSSGQIVCSGVETVVVTAQRPPAPKPVVPSRSLAGFILSGAMRAGAIEARVPEIGLPAAAVTLAVGAIAAKIISLANEQADQGNVDVDDPGSVRGADPDAVEKAAKEKGYTESEAKNKEGKRYSSPNGSDQVRVMRGNPNRPDPVKARPLRRNLERRQRDSCSSKGKSNVMNLKLNDADIKVLDLLADDYYGLWEVCDYFVQIMPAGDPSTARRRCRSRVRRYFDEGLIELFIGSMNKADFRKISRQRVPEILARKGSWATPDGLVGEVVAASATKKAEKLLANAN